MEMGNEHPSFFSYYFFNNIKNAQNSIHMSEIEERTCDQCSKNKPIDQYRKYCEKSYSKSCKKCLNEVDKRRKKNLRQKKRKLV